MNPITVRKASQRDIDALGALFIELDHHHFIRRPHEFLCLEGPARSREMIAGMVASETAAVFVAEEDASGRLVGLAHVHRRDFAPTIVAPARTVAEVDSLVVAPDARRRGVATRLLAEAQRWAALNGLTALELGVREFNADALAFYKAFGLVTASRRMTLTVA